MFIKTQKWHLLIGTQSYLLEPRAAKYVSYSHQHTQTKSDPLAQ